MNRDRYASMTASLEGMRQSDEKLMKGLDRKINIL